MPGNLSFSDLKKAVAGGTIDTVIVAMVDMQGRLVGKRFQAEFFVNGAHEETHGCDYLLADDIDMEPVPGYAAASWDKGYGDFVMKPDMTTLRRLPWLDGTALVLADVLDHHHHDVPHSPRAMLKAQVARLKKQKMRAYCASELEFYLFDESYEAIHAKGYHDALDMADNHAILKNGVKEIAHAQGKAVTFMSKWNYGLAGSSSHVHVSLWDAAGKTPLFFDKKAEFTMSPLMRSFVAGQLVYARDITYFLAPYINSYKRFQVSTFAPTKAVWSRDNRTAGFRLCGEGSKSIRIECRIGGADLNPYLAFAALIAAGLKGIEEKLTLDAPFSGDAYFGKALPEVPKTLREATECLDKSKMLRGALGDGVVDHYVHTAKWEQFEYDRRVTDWELMRGFERY